MNEFSLPNLTSEHIRWTPEYYTAKEFASYFRNRMPIVVKLTEGDDGTRSSSVGGERPGTVRKTFTNYSIIILYIHINHINNYTGGLLACSSFGDLSQIVTTTEIT